MRKTFEQVQKLTFKLSYYAMGDDMQYPVIDIYLDGKLLCNYLSDNFTRPRLRGLIGMDKNMAEEFVHSKTTHVSRHDGKGLLLLNQCGCFDDGCNYIACKLLVEDSRVIWKDFITVGKDLSGIQISFGKNVYDKSLGNLNTKLERMDWKPRKILIKAIFFDFNGVLEKDGKPNKEIVDFIQRNQGKYSFAALSELNEDIMPWLRKYKLTEYFDFIQSTWTLKQHKGYQDFFKAAAQKTGFHPEEILFVDDEKRYVELSGTAGMMSLLYMANTPFKGQIEPLL